MKQKKVLHYACGCLLLLLFCTYMSAEIVNEVSVKAQQFQKLKIKLIVVGNVNKNIEHITEIIKKNLEFSEQFVVTQEKRADKLLKISDVKNFFEPDCRLGIFLTKINKKTVGWRLYDLEYAQMVTGEKYKIVGKDVCGWAHNISDAIWPHLTGELGFFSTKIVYSKKVDLGAKKAYKHIYVADYDGSNEQLLVATPTVNMAPRWNNDPKKPLVFYSEHTNKNVRLMVVDMKGKRKVASNFDGLNILSAFSPDGKRFAYCASRGDGYCQLYYFDGALKKLTHTGNNISPTFADNGNTLYYCSDAHATCPRIYKYDLTQRENPTYMPECILNHGFQVATVFSLAKDMLAYSKMVSGTMQLFVYSPADGIHKQVTFGAGNKEECSWSPCGNYILYSIENKNASRLAMLNLLTNTVRYITSEADSCYYPFWSSYYNQFPAIG